MAAYCEAPIYDYQRIPSTWLQNHPTQKGLMVVLGTGFGKTRCAVEVAMSMLIGGAVTRCVVVTPAKLQDNFKQGLRECGALNLSVRVVSVDHFTTHVDELSIDEKTLIIVDESQNFRNKDTARYREMKRACAMAGRVVLFTATPNKTHVTDMIAQFALFLDITRITSDQDLFQRIRNQVVYLAMEGTVYDTKPKVVVYSMLVPMTPVQEQRIVEVMEENKITGIADLKRILNDADMEDSNRKQDKSHRALNAFFNKVRRFANSESASVCSPKMQAMADFIRDMNTQTLVFSTWRPMGVELGARCLQQAVPDMRIGTITGSATAKTVTSTLHDYNSQKIQTLFLSGAASEGISTTGTGLVVITEPQWQYVAEQQAIARGVRINSHPPGSEVVVLYLLSHSDKYEAANIDEFMFRRNRESYDSLLRGMDMLRQASVPVSNDAIVYYNYEPKDLHLTENVHRILNGVKGLPGKPTDKLPPIKKQRAIKAEKRPPAKKRAKKPSNKVRAKKQSNKVRAKKQSNKVRAKKVSAKKRSNKTSKKRPAKKAEEATLRELLRRYLAQG